MADPIKYQVFISSTYDDLVEERREVVRAVLEMGHIPVGMEMFSAADEEQWQIIARNIEQSDYYVVVVAHRYGSTVDGMSYTEKEYRYALEVGVPVLGLLIDESADWPADLVDRDEPAVSSLADFKVLVKSKPVSFWKSADDLGGKAAIALMKSITANPREGWVRAGQSLSTELSREIGRLSAENAELRHRLEEAESSSEAAHSKSIADAIDTMTTTTRQVAVKLDAGRDWEDVGERSLLSMFEIVGPPALVEEKTTTFMHLLGLQFHEDGTPRSIVPRNHLADWLADLHTLGLMGPSTARHSVNDEGEYWSLTPFGQEVLAFLRRRTLGGGSNEPPEGDPEDEGGDYAAEAE